MTNQSTVQDSADALELVVRCGKAERQWQTLQENHVSDAAVRRPAWDALGFCLRELTQRLRRLQFSTGYDTVTEPIGVYFRLLDAQVMPGDGLTSQEQEEMCATLEMLERELRRLNLQRSLADALAERKPRGRTPIRKARLDLFSDWLKKHDWTRLKLQEITDGFAKDTGLDLSKATISRDLKVLGKKPARREPRRTTGRGEQEAVAPPLEAYSLPPDHDE